MTVLLGVYKSRVLHLLFHSKGGPSRSTVVFAMTLQPAITFKTKKIKVLGDSGGACKAQKPGMQGHLQLGLHIIFTPWQAE